MALDRCGAPQEAVKKCEASGQNSLQKRHERVLPQGQNALVPCPSRSGARRPHQPAEPLSGSGRGSLPPELGGGLAGTVLVVVRTGSGSGADGAPSPGRAFPSK